MRKVAVLLLLAVGCSSAPRDPGPDGTGGSTDKGGAPGTGGRATGGKGGDTTGGAAATGGATATGGSGANTGGAMTGTGGAMTGTGGAMMGTGGSMPPPLTGTAFAYAAGQEFGGANITTFGFDLMTGALTRKGGGTGAGAGPDYVAAHPSGKFLFVNNETGAGKATAFSIGADGTLTMLNSASSGGGGPAHIWVHSSGKWLLSANYNDGKLGVAAIGEDGRLTATSSAQAGGNAHMALDDGITGNFVFVPCASAGHVAMFKFDVATGKATPNSPATISSPSRPRHMAVNPNGKWAYVTHESASAITTFAYDSTTGLLSNPKDTSAPNDGAHILVHPSGNFVFHIARGGGTTTVFKVGADGSLTAGTKVGGGYDGTITRDGKYLLVVSGSSVKVYAVNATTGSLTAAGTGTAVNGSQSVAVAVF